MHTKAWKKSVDFPVFLVLLALLGIGSGLLVGRSWGTVDSEADFEYRVPRSVDDLVHGSDLIVLGSLVSITDQGIFYGYDTEASRRAELDRTSPTPLGLPFVDYEVQVEDILFDRLDTQQQGTSLVLRVLENPQTSTSLATPREGDRRLFFLKRNPDNRTYGLPSIMSQLDVEGPVAVYYRGSSAVLPFGKRFSAEGLLRETTRAITSLHGNSNSK